MTAPVGSISFARCPLFHGMTPAEREEIISLLEPQSFSPEDTILAEGPTLQCLWILMKGTVRVVKSLSNGQVQELTRLEPLSVFGEMSFFAPAPHSASVQAVSAVEVTRLPRERYDMLLRTGSLAAYKLAYNTVGVLSERLRRMDELAAKINDGTPPIAHREELREFHSKLYSGWQF